MLSKDHRFFLAALILMALVVAPVDAGSCSDRPRQTASMSDADIVDTAVAAGSFNTLVAAVQAAGLVDALKGDGPLTVFAPTDEAFAKLPEGTLQSLLLPENKDALVSILTYHVAPGRLTASDVTSMDSIETLNGQRPAISMGADSVRIGEANITATDILTSNGVIHVIDTVLLPETKAPTAASAGVDLIRLAIHRGAPLYNAGQPEACAAIYEVAAWSLANAKGSELDRNARRDLEKAMSEAANSHDMRRRAWILRDALDSALESLDDSMTLADARM